MKFFMAPGIGFYSLIERSVRAYSQHEMAVHAEALAFRILFSLFPFIIFLIALLGFLQVPEFFSWLREQASPFLPAASKEQLDAVIQELQIPRAGLLSTGAATALWLASSAVRTLMKALNDAYAAKESRPAWKRYALSIVYTLGIAVMLVAAAAIMNFGPQAIRWITGGTALESVFVEVWTWLRWPVSLVLISVAVAIAYHLVPNVQHQFRLVSAGSVLSVTVWSVASLAFSYYVRNFANYDVMYGSIGVVIALLLYLYLSTSVLLFGAEVNAVIEKHASVQNDAAKAH